MLVQTSDMYMLDRNKIYLERKNIFAYLTFV
jgi:hypothetical protein